MILVYGLIALDGRERELVNIGKEVDEGLGGHEGNFDCIPA